MATTTSKTFATTTNTRPPASTDSYAAGYARLGAIAEKLKSATGAATIDTLLADVQEARALHAQLKGRLDAVRRELEAEVSATDAGDAS